MLSLARISLCGIGITHLKSSLDNSQAPEAAAQSSVAVLDIDRFLRFMSKYLCPSYANSTRLSFSMMSVSAAFSEAYVVAEVYPLFDL